MHSGCVAGSRPARVLAERRFLSIRPCGTLEDPLRFADTWRRWWAGALAVIGGHGLVAAALPQGPFIRRRSPLAGRPALSALLIATGCLVIGLIARIGEVAGINGFFSGATAALASGVVFWVYLSWFVAGQDSMAIRLLLLATSYAFGVYRIWISSQGVFDHAQVKASDRAVMASYPMVFVGALVVSLLGWSYSKRRGGGRLGSTLYRQGV